MDITFYLFALAVFISVVFTVEGAYLWWVKRRSAEARRLARRLEDISSGSHTVRSQVSILKQRLFIDSPRYQQIVSAVPRVAAVEKLLTQSGLAFTAGAFIGRTMLFAAAGFVLSWFVVGSVVWSLAGAVASGAAPLLYVFRARQRRINKIVQQLPDAIDLVGRAIRAGHAFSNAVQMAGDELPEPIAGEFRILFDEVNYGTAMDDALINLANRVPSLDLKYVVIAVLIHRESGGNLAELLDNLSTIIRARLKLLGTIRVLSAEGRLSARILGLLPFGTGAVIYLVNPGFLSLLWTDPAGKAMLYIVGLLMLMGFFWMRKIIRIRV